MDQYRCLLGIQSRVEEVWNCPVQLVGTFGFGGQSLGHYAKTFGHTDHIDPFSLPVRK